MQLNAAGQVELKLKTPWRNGTMHRVMSPGPSVFVHALHDAGNVPARCPALVPRQSRCMRLLALLRAFGRADAWHQAQIRRSQRGRRPGAGR